FAMYALVAALRPGLISHVARWDLMSGASALAALAGYSLYRLSLHLQAQFGATFRSIFDVFREKLKFDDIIEGVADFAQDPHLKSDSKAGYKALWRYLHNNRVKIGGVGPSLRPQEVEFARQPNDQNLRDDDFRSG